MLNAPSSSTLQMFCSQALPEIDVCFDNFKGVPKVPPNNRAMAGRHNGHQVVRYIKALPVMYTNLPEPKSMYVEDLVKRVEQQIKKDARQAGIVGFHTLLTSSLQVGADGCSGRAAAFVSGRLQGL